MRFWDSSAVVPLLVREPVTRAIQEAYAADPDVVVAWTTPVECASALARTEREGLLSAAATIEAFARLDDLLQRFREVEPIADQRSVARRLLRVHPLRAGDALQLAAAHLAAEGRPSALDLVTLDDRLAAAAHREGFRVITPTA